MSNRDPRQAGHAASSRARSGAVTLPARAWLRPEDDEARAADYATCDRGTWSLYLEAERATESAGPFRRLVSDATAAGAAELYVWSMERVTFERYTPAVL